MLFHIQSVYLMFVVSISLAAVLVYHLTLVSRNFTVLETIGRNMVWSLGLPCRNNRVISPFHTGSVLSNLKQVFGSNWFAFVPIADIPNAVAAEIANTDHVSNDRSQEVPL